MSKDHSDETVESTIPFYDQFVMVLGHGVEGVNLVGELLANSLESKGVILD